MALFRWFWAVFLFIVAAVTAADTTLRRTTLLVYDLEQSIAFYSTLGLKPFYDAKSSLNEDGSVIGGDDLPLAGNPADSRIVILIGPHEETGMIGLLAYDDPPLNHVRTPVAGQGRGDVILMFTVEDIRHVHRELEALGTRFHSNPDRYEVKNDHGSVQSTGWRMFAYDPDNRLVEITQRDKETSP